MVSIRAIFGGNSDSLYSGSQSSRASKRATPVPDVEDITSDDDYSDGDDAPESSNLKGMVWQSAHVK
jgi:hypothetical protein